MANYSKFLSLQSGIQKTVDLSSATNVLELGGNLQMDNSTNHIILSASLVTSTYQINWPPAQAASSSYTLSNDGTGNLSWVPLSTGSVSAISVNTSNGFAGTSSGGGTPALTLTTTVSGMIKGSSSQLVAATAGTDYSAGTSALATGILKSTTSTGALSIAVAGTDYVVPTGSITGTAANITATSNSTLTTLSALSLPGSQVSGNISGNAANITATSNSTLTTLSALSLPYSQVTGGPSVNAITALTGDGTASGPGSATLTLATVNTNTGSWGSSTAIPNFTVNGKGLITAAGTSAVVAPAGTLSGTTLNSTVVSSSLTSLGTQAQALNMGSHQINGLSTPSVSTDAATKGYVDAAINGLTWEGPAKAYANYNVPLTGGASLTIDGYSVQNGDLVILGNQTTASQNGEYSASGIGTAYTLTANGLPTAAGDAWLITNGTVYANSAFVAKTAVPAATFTAFAGPTAYTFNTPLSLAGSTVSISQANTSTNGYLSSTDWNTFNGKQAAGNYITALTGDATASGPGSAAITFATVNSNTGSFGSSTAIPNFTVNGKGLITAAGTSAVVAPAGTLSGTTLNSTVVSSSLTSVGTITSGVWNGTAIAIGNGGTGQSTATLGFDALSPLTTTGDIIYYNGTHNVRLGIGSSTQVLTVSGGVPTWAAASTGTVTSIGMTVPAFLSVSPSSISTSGTFAVSLSGTALPIANGGTGVTSVTTTPTASAWSAWDANKNYAANNLIDGFATTATSATTTTLTVASASIQVFTGTTTQTVALPVVTTLTNGLQFTIVNQSTGVVTVQTSGANTVQAMAANTQLCVTCVNTAGGTGLASWIWDYYPLSTSTLPITLGGTGASTAAAAYNNLSPMTTTGDIEYEVSSGTAGRLGIGSAGQVLTVSGGVPAWSAVSPGSITVATNDIIVGNGSNVGVAVAMSGDVGIVAGGATTIQANAVTASKIASSAFDGVTVTGGNGSAAAVQYAPALKRVLTAGQAFSANVSYCIRWGITANGETANRVYACDPTTSSYNFFYCIGMGSSTTAVSAGQSITVTTLGSFSLSSADSAFAANTDGAPVYMTASGTFSLTAPSTSGQAVTKVGVVQQRSTTVTSNIIDVAPQVIGIN